MNRAFAILLGAISTAACGGRTELLASGGLDGSTEGSSVADAGANPLLGTWLYAAPSTPYTESITFGSGGALEVTLSGAGCTGELQLSVLSWTATTTAITVTGTESCSGSLVCSGGGAPIACGMAPTNTIETTCTYALSNADDQLTLGPCVNRTGTPIAPGGPDVVLTRK
jgi:hypothetical protein